MPDQRVPPRDIVWVSGPAPEADATMASLPGISTAAGCDFAVAPCVLNSAGLGLTTHPIAHGMEFGSMAASFTARGSSFSILLQKTSRRLPGTRREGYSALSQIVLQGQAGFLNHLPPRPAEGTAGRLRTAVVGRIPAFGCSSALAVPSEARDQPGEVCWYAHNATAAIAILAIGGPIRIDPPEKTGNTTTDASASMMNPSSTICRSSGRTKV